MKQSALQRINNKLSKSPQKKGSPVMVYVTIFALCSYLLLVGLGRIYLVQEINNMETRILKINKTDILRQEKDYNNLKIDKEKFMEEEYISPRAKRLGLLPPNPEHVTPMVSIVDAYDVGGKR